MAKTDNPPMTYEYYHRVIKGSAPKNAPTYRAEDESAAKPEPSVKYRCTVCGYIYDGELANEPTTIDARYAAFQRIGLYASTKL